MHFVQRPPLDSYCNFAQQDLKLFFVFSSPPPPIFPTPWGFQLNILNGPGWYRSLSFNKINRITSKSCVIGGSWVTLPDATFLINLCQQNIMFLSFNISSKVAKKSWIIVLKWSTIKATHIVLLILFFRYTEFLFFPYSFSGPQVSFREVSNTKLDDLLLYTGTSALIIYISNIQREQKYSAVMYSF